MVRKFCVFMQKLVKPTMNSCHQRRLLRSTNENIVYYGDITRVWSRMDFTAVQAAHEHFGQLDVIVNNTGY